MMAPISSMTKIVIVLIDTWWNVNSFHMTALRVGKKRFNRYMVECELQCTKKSDFIITVLIDTWWNVNENSY